MVSKKVTKLRWGYRLVHQDGIFSRIASGETGLMGIDEVTVYMPYISYSTLTSMIVYGGLIRIILQQWMIALSLGNGSVYHKQLVVTCAIGY